ncbi:MAG: hypothetical protein NTV62_03050 [Candidatus Gribaldobacteria bacterium]|nr:hypothetical protein [Candidatus Gribaldobacteria bacterium]
MTIFTKNKKYTLEEIGDICDENCLITVDCLKDENMVSIEEYENGELGGECLFEFHRISEDVFKLTWQEESKYMPEKYR